MRTVLSVLVAFCLLFLAAPASAQRVDGLDIFRGVFGLGFEAERRRQQEAQRQRPQTPRATQPRVQSGSSLSRNQMRQVQQSLIDLGYDPGAADGLMGPRTRSALQAFQRDRGLVQSGTANRQTIAVLEEALRARRGVAFPTARAGDSPEVVRDAQQLLGSLGYLPGTPDGRMGPQTQQALNAFQTKYGLPRTGVPDVGTMELLRSLSGQNQRVATSAGQSVDRPQTPTLPSNLIGHSEGEALYLVSHGAGQPQHTSRTAVAVCVEPSEAERVLIERRPGGPRTTFLRQQYRPTNFVAEAMMPYGGGSSVVVTEACLEPLIETYTRYFADRGADRDDLVVAQLTAGAPGSRQPASSDQVVTTPPPAPLPTGHASFDGLIRIDGRPALLTGDEVPMATRSLKPNAERLATALHYMALLEGHGTDLRALDVDALTRNDQVRLFHALPTEARQRLMSWSLDLQAVDRRRRDNCAVNFERGSRDSVRDCVFSAGLSVFDQRRLSQELVAEVARAAEVWRGAAPIEVHVVCAIRGRRLSDSYNFSRGALNWEHFFRSFNGCRPQWMTGAVPARSVYFDNVRLSELLPSETEVPANEAEALGARLQQAGLMFTFPARIAIHVQGGGVTPLERVSYRFERLGPIDLRQPQAPDEPLLVLTAPGALVKLEADFDLAQGNDLSGLAALARPLEEIAAPAFARAFMEGAPRGDAPTIRFQASASSDSRNRDLWRLRISQPQRSGNAQMAEHVAAALRVPSSHVGLVFEEATRRALFAVATRPIGGIATEAELGSEGISGLESSMVAALEHVVSLDVAGNEALVAFLDPREFVLTRRVNREVRARIALEPEPRPGLQQIFIPPPSWYALRDARERGEDPLRVLQGLAADSGLLGGSSFEREEAIRAAAMRAQALEQAFGGDDIWIAGTLRLGPYNQARQAFPIAAMSLAAPMAGALDRAIASQIMPHLPESARLVPVPVEVARARQDDLAESRSYVFRARIALKERFRSEGRNARMELTELSLVRGHVSGSVVPDTGFVPGSEIYRVVHAPAATEPAVPEPMASAPGNGAWDILGVRLDMSIEEAERALVASLGAEPSQRLHLSPKTIMAGSGGDLFTPYRQGVFLAFGENEGIALFHEPPTGADNLVAVSRTRSYPDGARPSSTTLIEALHQKYGDPIGEVDGGLIWFVEPDSERLTHGEAVALSACRRGVRASVAQTLVLSRLRLRQLDRGRQPWQSDPGNRITGWLVDDTGAPAAAPLGAATLMPGNVTGGCGGPSDILIAMSLLDGEGLVRQFDTILFIPSRAQEQSQANAQARQNQAPAGDAARTIRLDL